MEQCRQGSRQNGSVTGKRIGSEGWARRSQFEPVDCWRTARAANAARAARRVSAEGRTGNSSLGIIQPDARGTVDSHNWSSRLVEKPVARSYRALDYD
ncbi:hypothetical protein Bca101_102216 [Brassica carinata]